MLKPDYQRAGATMHSEHPTGARRIELPFTVRIVRSNEQLARATMIRASAYSRHTPGLGSTLSVPETTDRDPDSIVFIAESKVDGEPLGTIRIQTNFKNSLVLEQSVRLPSRFAGSPMAGVSRLAVRSGTRGRMVKLALFKAMHRYCLAKQVEWALIGARPPLDKDYEKLEFIDVFEDKLPRPLHSASGIPHRILAFDVPTAEKRWYATNHPLYSFMFRTWTPDIQIFASVSNPWGGAQRTLDSSQPVAQGPSLDVPIV